MNELIRKKLDTEDLIREDLVALSKAIYARPELGYEEHYASELHVALLEKHGFQVERAYLGLKTGFRAEYHSTVPGPVICYMAEYDALPGIGHGCGHNILGATSTGAGILLQKLMGNLGGTVVVLGTPAEETSGAKVFYVEKGAFDDVSAAMIAHPGTGHYRSGSSLALEAIEFDYKGKASHAASEPEKGVNALDAAIGTFNMINALRQQTREDARIHGIITKGGVAANIIPDDCAAQFYVRAKSKAYLAELVEQVKNCARGAAAAAGVWLEIVEYEAGYDNMVTNQRLSDLYSAQLRSLGVTEILEPRKTYGSLDAGNVSHVCPTIHPYFPITEDREMAAHTKEFGACTLSEYAEENMMITAKALALTGAALMKDVSLLEDIKKEFAVAEK
ncbi:MAG: M20 family metallopeptidase [Eubacteriales bacterium]|nr:M20 family metallopeptidase [Eubacteriales bacterium]